MSITEHLVRAPRPAPTDTLVNTGSNLTVSGHRIRQGQLEHASTRLILALISLTALAVGLLGWALELPEARLVGLLVYGLFGLGLAPWNLAGRLDLAARVALAGVTSLTIMAFAGGGLLVLHTWQPATVFGGLAAPTAALHLYLVWAAVTDLRTRPLGWLPGQRWPLGRRRALGEGWSAAGRTRPEQWLAQLLGPTGWPIPVALSGGAFCLVAALTHRHLEPGFWGFLAEIGPFWYAGLVLVLLAVVGSGRVPERCLAISVTVLMLIITVTPALVYDGPRSQSAAKHVDLILQIWTLHELDSQVEVYNSWPGFFAAMAWLCDVGGLSDPIHLATAWPALIGVFRLAALRMLAGRITNSPRQAWLAVALAVLADPIGTDYFSPQSVGFVTGLVIFALALSGQRAAVIAPVLVLFGSFLAMSHQLSPFVVGGVLGVLVLLRQVRPWWLPATVLAPAIGWALLHQSALEGMISLHDIGQAHNFRAPRTVSSAGLDRLPLVSYTVLALVLGIAVVGLLAAAAVLRDWRRRSIWALAACPVVGLLGVALTPYGNEGIFRAALFGIPWLALLSAGLLGDLARLRLRVLWTGLVPLLTTTFLVASFGLDSTNVSRPADLAALRQFTDQSCRSRSEICYLLQLGSGDLPTSPPTRHGHHRLVNRINLGVPVRQEPPHSAPGLVERMTERMLRYSGDPPDQAQLYALWSPVSRYHGWEYGIQRPEQFVELREAFRTAGYWRVVSEREGTVLFQFSPAGWPAGGRR